MTGPVWVDGTLLDHVDATVSVFDHGLTVGDGIFETMKTVGREPFALTRHLRRLRSSAAGLGLEVDRTDDELRAALDDLIAAHPGGELRVRLTVTGGPGPAGSDRAGSPPTTIVTAAPLPEHEPTTEVITVEWRRNEHSAVTGLKTTSYAENVVALAAAHERGATEALFANTAGKLCEGTGSNVFVVLDGELVTPPLSSGCLAGITRELVVEITEVSEVDLHLGVLGDADEVFLTSSTRDVQGVVTVDGVVVGRGGTTPVTDDVRARFLALQARSTDP